MKSSGDPGVTRRGSAKSKGWGRQPVRERSHWQRPRPIKMAYVRLCVGVHTAPTSLIILDTVTLTVTETVPVMPVYGP